MSAFFVFNVHEIFSLVFAKVPSNVHEIFSLVFFSVPSNVHEIFSLVFTSVLSLTKPSLHDLSLSHPQDVESGDQPNMDQEKRP